MVKQYCKANYNTTFIKKNMFDNEDHANRYIVIKRNPFGGYFQNNIRNTSKSLLKYINQQFNS